jgi:hypothetical protein
MAGHKSSMTMLARKVAAGAKGIALLSSSCVCVCLRWMLGLLMMDMPFTILPSTSFYGKGNNIYRLADERGLFF